MWTVSIPDPGSSSKNLSILTPKKAKKWFQSSKKYDPGCSYRIPDLYADFLPSRIPDPDPGVEKAPNPGSRIRNTGYKTVEIMVYLIADWRIRTNNTDPDPISPEAYGLYIRLRNTPEQNPIKNTRLVLP